MSNSAESRLSPAGNPDPRVPLMNLSTVRERMDSLQQFLSKSVNTNTLISEDEMNMVSSEISNAIQQIIVNGAALLACSQSVEKRSDPPDLIIAQTKFTNQLASSSTDKKKPGFKVEESDDFEADYDVVEMDAVELLAEHVHFCEICGKGFKRDANLRMHMRAHGNQFKTPEALAKPDKGNGPAAAAAAETERKRRFSCPYEGCNRNKKHTKFRPLKSVICVRNHFKRSHCPKMYSCNRCNKKSFSVVADLKSHLKHCGESRWKCSCGTTFSRKDKLFGHMALFEGHMPAIVGENEEDEEAAEVIKSEQMVMATEEDEIGIVKREEMIGNCMDNDDYFEGLLDGFGSMVNGYDLQDVLGSPTGWDNCNNNNNGIHDFLFTGQS